MLYFNAISSKFHFKHRTLLNILFSTKYPLLTQQLFNNLSFNQWINLLALGQNKLWCQFVYVSAFLYLFIVFIEIYFCQDNRIISFLFSVCPLYFSSLCYPSWLGMQLPILYHCQILIKKVWSRKRESLAWATPVLMWGELFVLLLADFLFRNNVFPFFL